MSESVTAASVWSRHRGLLWKAFSLLFFIAALVFLARTLGTEGVKDVGSRLRDARPRFLVLAVLSNFACYVAWAVRWRALLRPVASVPWWPAQKALMASICVNTVVPFARSLGGLVRAAHLGRSLGRDVATIYGPTLLDQIGYSTMSVVLGAFSLPLAAWSGPTNRPLRAVAVLAAAAALTIAVLLARKRRATLLSWIQDRIPGAADAVERGVTAARRVVLRPATWIVIPAGGLAVWLFNVLTLLLAGRAIGAGFGFGAAAAAWSLGSMAGVTSGSPGGVGVTESVGIVPLIALGVPAPDALAAILLARFIHYLSAVTIGGICLIRGPREEPRSGGGPLALESHH